MKRLVVILSTFFFFLISSKAQEKIFPGADENTPSKAQYFSWINNTNEGTNEEHTRINLDFFAWLKEEYGMQLDIYAFDAGAIDGARFYGSIYSDRFKKQFPNGFDPLYQQAKSLGIRLGVWGGPDGFGDTPEEEKNRADQMVKLCRDYEFALFKFDAVCGPLRPEKEDAFINMMRECRKYSPDLILLNHRLGLNKSKPYATTFLFGGAETYIDVHMTNSITAPHNRAEALSRGLVPGLQRLTEDHGVCLSSCLDYWDDDLVLQAFNRSLILAPQIYGNPWLLHDDEFSKLARIYNLHRKYRNILFNGKVLPESYGPHAVSRGDKNTRLITLRNLQWTSEFYTIKLDEEIGLESKGKITLIQLHPTEKVLGNFKRSDQVTIEVLPFRSYMLLATSEKYDEPAIIGSDFQVLKNVKGKPVEIEILGMPGTKSEIALINPELYNEASLDGENNSELIDGKTIQIDFPGEELKDEFHRHLGSFKETEIPEDAETLYEATVFSTDNNALEVRSLERSGKTSVQEVKAARDAFFNQKAFVERGVWDRNLFDGDTTTGFWQTRRYQTDRGCLRIDLGKIQEVDEIILTVPDMFSLLPILPDEGNYVEISTDLKNWEQITFMTELKIRIPMSKPVRYLRFNRFPQQISEIEGVTGGKSLDRSLWRASNLFAHPNYKKPVKTWKTEVKPEEVAKGSYLCVAINGKHGREGAYAAAKVDGKFIGAPNRAPSHLSNPWESFNPSKEKNYTYYIPMLEEYKGKTIEVFVMGYDEENLNFFPDLWITAYPHPWERKLLVLNRK
ncbi:MAG: discoidin domain-containing protein [Mariniphaga sp.]|nr:discoidin domain-containing protein [Mariniphaga sp.]